ncbi:MAG: hypothetical protein ACRC0Y_08970 [Fusobacteriaceae bacterium]
MNCKICSKQLTIEEINKRTIKYKETCSECIKKIIAEKRVIYNTKYRNEKLKVETLEEREARLLKKRTLNKIAQAKRDAAKIEKQREYNRKSIALKKAKGTYNKIIETPEQREIRLSKARLRARRILAEETPEQRVKRLAKLKESRLKRSEKETPEERETRLSKAKEYYNKFKNLNPEKIVNYQKVYRSKEEAKELKRQRQAIYREKNKTRLNEEALEYYRKKALKIKEQKQEDKNFLFEIMKKIEEGEM